jgi:hypothetical protein
MGSSRRAGNKILGVIDPARAEAFLLQLANPPTSGKITTAYAETLRKRYPEMAEPVWKSLEEWTGNLIWIQLYLRHAWDAPDARHRDWYLHEMRRQYSHAAAELALGDLPTPPDGILSVAPGMVVRGFEPMIDRVYPGFIEPPEVTPFEAAVFYFQSRIGDRAKYCGHVDCPAPYFIAVKRWQKFCSEKCAGPANRESKRKWWHNKQEGRKK